MWENWRLFYLGMEDDFKEMETIYGKSGAVDQQVA